MKKFSILLLVLVLFMPIGCTEEDADVESTSPVVRSQVGDLTFESSGFSSYIELSTDKNYLRFAFSFFPDGTGFDFDKKKVSIPCSFLMRIPDDVDVQLSAPLEEDCEIPYTISFDSEGETFTLDGIVVHLNSSYDRFADDFEFIVSADGIKDAVDGTVLTSGRGKLEDFYDLILKERS